MNIEKLPGYAVTGMDPNGGPYSFHCSSEQADMLADLWRVVGAAADNGRKVEAIKLVRKLFQDNHVDLLTAKRFVEEAQAFLYKP